MTACESMSGLMCEHLDKLIYCIAAQIITEECKRF